MEPSPLTQVSPPEVFQPKIIHLYESLFEEDVEDIELSEGFWEEFFLHRPDSNGLKRILEPIPPDDMLHMQAHSQQLFLRAMDRIKQASTPSNEIALETLTVFLGSALVKKYTNPSSDIISVLAGLHDADAVISDFVATLEACIRNGKGMNVRLKAIRAALSVTAAGFQTVLPSYLTHRDLFPALMRYIQDCQQSANTLPALYLLGLLVNYNKFEFQNPYRLRLDDFVNETIIQKMMTSFGESCVRWRDSYVAVQDDTPKDWSIGSTLNYFSLGILSPASRPTTPTPVSGPDSKTIFAVLPPPEIGSLLAIYDFSNANKVFCSSLASTPAATHGDASPLNSLLSLVSYLLQHAHRSQRAGSYAHLSLLIIRLLIEDQTLAKRLYSEENKITVRLCRQRQPFLPLVKGDRLPVAIIVDLILDGINHNLKRKLDVDFYILCLGILLRILSHLSRAKARISYHWSETWRTSLSFVRFLTTYAKDIQSIYRCSAMVKLLVKILAFALSNGETFLPDPAAYDDLVYKLVETGDNLAKFSEAFELGGSASMQSLLSVSTHYRNLLEADNKGKGRNKNLSPHEVSQVIKQGYGSLSFDAGEGLDQWEKYREADHKSFLKKMARIAVEDAKRLDERP